MTIHRINPLPESGQMHAETLTVGPDLARKWLKQNTNNRALSAYVVKSYARQMRQGEWLLTHQGIAFDEYDCLLDGQHRLQAIVEAGVSVPMRVTFGVPRTTFDRVDVGTKRGAYQFLGKNGSTINGAARLLFDDWTTVRTPKRTPTPHEILRLVNERPTLTEFAQTAKTVYAKTRISASQHLAVLAVAATTEYRDSIESWVDGLLSGAGLHENDPRLHLRNRWAVRSKQLNAHRLEGPYLLTRAWNAHVKGEEVRLIKWSATYSPLPIIGASKGDAA